MKQKQYKPIRIYAKNPVCRGSFLLPPPIAPGYLATTREAKSLKEAKEKYVLTHPDFATSDLLAYYQG